MTLTLLHPLFPAYLLLSDCLHHFFGHLWGNIDPLSFVLHHPKFCWIFNVWSDPDLQLSCIVLVEVDLLSRICKFPLPTQSFQNLLPHLQGEKTHCDTVVRCCYIKFFLWNLQALMYQRFYKLYHISSSPCLY